MSQQISDAELRIMRIIWAHSPEPVRFAPLMQELADTGHACRKNTLITLLGRLISKGYLEAKKIGRVNEYTAVVDSTAFHNAQVRGFVDKYYEGSAAGLVNTLIQSDLLSPEEYNELRASLEGTGK